MLYSCRLKAAEASSAGEQRASLARRGSAMSHNLIGTERPRRYRLLALVKAEAFTPHVQRHGEKLQLNVGDEKWFRENIPCQQACPVHTDIPRYIALIAQGDYEGAYAANKQSNLWPAILGRVCHRPCEAACRRGLKDRPVAICHLKRAAADFSSAQSLKVEGLKPSARGKKIAIVGSGPAGLAAAHDLAALGHAVTIYEAHNEAGGMLSLGIPPYRLPRQFTQEAIAEIKKLGVEIMTRRRVGQDIKLEDLMARYDAVLLAVGAQRSLKLNIPGEEAEGVLGGLEFMMEVNVGRRPGRSLQGKRVAVIGGGYTAVDCARSAVRLGAKKVLMLYRRTQAEMTAGAVEIEGAIEEGVEIHYLVSPKRVLTRNGWVFGLECIRNRLGEPDESGRPRPIPIDGSEFIVDVDFIIAATGQATNLHILKEAGLELATDGRLIVDKETLMTARRGVFAAGDCVTGPSTVIEAIAAGRKAAASIDRYLRSHVNTLHVDTLKPSYVQTCKRADVPTLIERRLAGEDNYEKIERQKMPALPVEERAHFKREVELGYSKEEAAAEAQRCYQCQLNVFVEAEKCILCNKCVEICPQQCLSIISFNRIANDLPYLSEARAWLDGGALIIEEGLCSRCCKCVKVCPPQCLLLKQSPHLDKLDAIF